MIDEDAIAAHRLRGLEPDRPVMRGTAQNPDVFFQAREAANLFHDAVPGIVQESMDRVRRPHRPPVPACSTTTGHPRPSGSS